MLIGATKKFGNFGKILDMLKKNRIKSVLCIMIKLFK